MDFMSFLNYYFQLPWSAVSLFSPSQPEVCFYDWSIKPLKQRFITEILIDP